MIHTVDPKKLRWTIPDDVLDVAALEANDEEKTGRPGALGQERALAALELGLGIRERGFNIFVVGASGTGRTSTVKTVLHEQAAQESAPADVVLLYNFDDRDRPHAACLPPGTGPKVKRVYDNFVEEMIRDLEKVFESDAYVAQRQELEQVHQDRTAEMLKDVEEEAKGKGFILTRSQGALTLGVADENGNSLNEEDYEKLTPEQRQELEERAETLQIGLEEALRRIRSLEKETDEQMEGLARRTADAVLEPLIGAAQAELKDIEQVRDHLDAVREDILDRLARLVPEEAGEEPHPEEAPRAQSARRRLVEEEEDSDRDEPALLRYRVNVLVTHDHDAGAPVVQETHPTASNLLGRIVHKNRGGEATTDHTLIKAGALYRANGGYLVINAQDLLREPTAWEGLKRALKNREIELDDPGEPGRMLTIASLRPEPVPLAVKVCLIGTPDLYYALSRGDPDFGKLFKVKVDFDLEMDRSSDRLQKYLSFIVGLAHEEKLRKVAPSGAARLLEHAARLSHHQDKLTTRFGWIADLVREANFYAGKAGSERINREHVVTALESRAEREGFIELRMREDISDQRVRVETTGEVTGQCNGLTVLDLGSYQFGMPVRITARIGAGKGEMIDIERESDLGGPIHTKGNLILRGILLDRFGGETPLKLSSTVCIEQSYSDIDGDSASMAEACALLSALADAPLRQDLALTGSVDQRGQVQAVGGVNEKVEGFYRVVRERLDEGAHGVIIPASNAGDLMLDEDVIKAVESGRFQVHTSDTLEDTLELLTGRKWDKGRNALRPAILKKLLAFAGMQDYAKSSGSSRSARTKALPKAAKSRRSDS